VVDVRDDAEIPYELWIHVSRLSLSAAIAFSLFSYRQEPLLLRTIRHTRSETVPSNIQFATNSGHVQHGGELTVWPFTVYSQT
jgi:hypothetical protein